MLQILRKDVINIMPTRREFIKTTGLTLAALLLARCAPETTGNPAIFPTPKKPELLVYLDTLEKEGLIRVGYFSTPDQPAVHNVVIPKSGEVTEKEVDLDLLASVATFLERKKDFPYAGYTLKLVRPVEQNIIILDRTVGLPVILADRGEVTFNLNREGTRIATLINLSGPQKTIGGTAFSTSWSMAQGVCLGYCFNSKGCDAICNVLAANIAAGWTNTDPSGDWIRSLKDTSVMDGVSVPFTFNQDIWNTFRQAAVNVGK